MKAVRTWIVAAILGIGVGQSLVRAAAQASGSIEGIVIRSGTTDPVSGVDLELTRIEGTKAFPLAARTPAGPPIVDIGPDGPLLATPSDVLTMRTKADGRFRFAALLPGTYRLLAARSDGAYCPIEFGQRDPKGQGIPIVLSEGESLRDVRMEMAPTGTISGRIVDENGNPAGRVRVMAIESRWKSGKQEAGLIEAMYSDDLGEYRLFWLPPGRYYIAAKPEDPRRQNLSVLLSQPGSADPSREVFPVATVAHRILPSGETVAETVDPVYHGGAADLQSARAIELGPGAIVSGIDIALGAGSGRARTLRGVVLDAAGRPVKSASVTATLPADGPSVVMPAVMSAPDGSFELTIGPGSYLLRAMKTDGRFSSAQDALIHAASFGVGVPAAVIPIPAGSDAIENLTMVLRSGINIDGNVIVEGPQLRGNEADILGIQFRLVADRNYFPPSTASTTIDGFFAVTDVQPGDYHMSVSPLLNLYTASPNNPAAPAAALQDYYVKSIRLGSIDVLNDGLHVGNSIDGTFEIVLGSNGGMVEGDVEETGRGTVSNATVVLVPDGVSGVRPDLYKRVSSDRSGHFTIRAVTPGDYRLFAWRQIEDGIWFDPDFVRANRGRGMSVHVMEGRNPPLKISVAP